MSAARGHVAGPSKITCERSLPSGNRFSARRRSGACARVRRWPHRPNLASMFRNLDLSVEDAAVADFSVWPCLAARPSRQVGNFAANAPVPWGRQAWHNRRSHGSFHKVDLVVRPLLLGSMPIFADISGVWFIPYGATFPQRDGANDVGRRRWQTTTHMRAAGVHMSEEQ
jgi:hypothetical protein